MTPDNQVVDEALRDLGGAAMQSASFLGGGLGVSILTGAARVAQHVLGGQNTVGMGAVTGNTSRLKVRLASAINPIQVVVFEAQPRFVDSRSAEYVETNILHHPGQMAVYKTTRLRTITLDFKFYSRNEEEADKNYYYIRLLRSWVMPRHGISENLGAPPDILYLSGLGTIFGNYGYGGQADRIPVVLTSYSLNFNDESTDYISTGSASTENQFQPVPIVLSGSVTLMEAYSPNEFKEFNIASFADGLLVDGRNNYFTRSVGASAASAGGTTIINSIGGAIGGAVAGVKSLISGAVTGMMGLSTDSLNNVDMAKPATEFKISDSTGETVSVSPTNAETTLI